jgi:hypothetical protein
MSEIMLASMRSSRSEVMRGATLTVRLPFRFVISVFAVSIALFSSSIPASFSSDVVTITYSGGATSLIFTGVSSEPTCRRFEPSTNVKSGATPSAGGLARNPRVGAAHVANAHTTRHTAATLVRATYRGIITARERADLLRDAQRLADRVDAFVREARDLHVGTHLDGLRCQAPPDICDECCLDLRRNSSAVPAKPHVAAGDKKSPNWPPCLT